MISVIVKEEASQFIELWPSSVVLYDIDT